MDAETKPAKPPKRVRDLWYKPNRLRIADIVVGGEYLCRMDWRRRLVRVMAIMPGKAKLGVQWLVQDIETGENRMVTAITRFYRREDEVIIPATVAEKMTAIREERARAATERAPQEVHGLVPVAERGVYVATVDDAEEIEDAT